MKLGVTFPQTEIGTNPADIRDYTQAVEAMGYEFVIAYDHVLGAALDTRPDWSGPYNSETPFYEPFTLFSYMAAISSTLEFASSVIILPQRQTALVAKQAASLDVLCNGRFRLGVGVGWNSVEYDALGEQFSNRGARCEEQIALLRALWSKTAITFKGQWHTIDNAGINPLPPRRTIPIYLGGYSEIVLQRAARLADGWSTFRAPDDTIREALERLRGYTVAAGRDAASVAVETQISLFRTPADEWADFASAWRDLGASYFAVNTMSCGFTNLGQHLDALKQFITRVAG